MKSLYTERKRRAAVQEERGCSAEFNRHTGRDVQESCTGTERDVQESCTGTERDVQESSTGTERDVQKCYTG